MSDNGIIDMLERKLAEKEKEIEELKRMNEMNEERLRELKVEIVEEVKEKVVEELAVQLKNEILSLKRDSENEKILADRISAVEAKLLELVKTVEELTKEILYLKSEKIVKTPPKRDKVKQQLKSSKTAKLVGENDSDIIVCD